jgi:ribosomal protein L11 methyltransferase
MAWLELKMNATSEAVDWVRTLLASEGHDWEVQLGEAGDAIWDWQIQLYLPATTSNSRLEAILRLLSPLQRTKLISEPKTAIVSAKPVQQPFVHPLGKFVLIAADTAEQFGDAIPLRLSTSSAFGSGFHPATILSLRLLERYVVPGMRVLDLGCGSGILSVAAAKLGAEVLALDNDPIAVEATQQAVRDNQIGDLVSVKAGSLGQGSELGHWMGGMLDEAVAAIQPTSEFDLIVANILARIHMALAAEYREAMRSGGTLITAGYTTDMEAEVDAALTAAGFAALDTERFDDWVALAYRV